MARRRIIIPEGTVCPDCGLSNLTGRGIDWKANPYGDNPPRIKVQMLRCKDCGKIFADGEIKNESEVHNDNGK